MSFSNNGTKVRIFGEITKFFSDFFAEKRTFFWGGYSSYNLFTPDILISEFLRNIVFNIIYIIIYIILI